MNNQADHRTKAERDAYRLLYAGFVAAPIVAGVDKFFDKLGFWDKYLSDKVADKLPTTRHTFMEAVGVIEVVAGVLVAAKPKWGGYVVGAWLAGIVANLWTKPQYRDIALRDLGLALGALALARLAQDAPEETAMAHLRSA
ncbi:MAG: hypothetical protein E6L09_14675 [Verrucomicrobia bacterium]|nr:MAG: hypothetical protein E6L09_14675 [Verrucomicrobiota bacterium]